MDAYIPNPFHTGPQTSAPRFLTPKEKQDIIARIEFPLGGTSEVAKMSRDQIAAHLNDILDEVMLPEEYIQPFSDEIVAQYMMSRVKPGKGFGMRIAESFIAPIMQATLNTRHKAGSGDGTGFDEVREVLFMPAKRKSEEVYLHFNTPKSKDEIYDLRKVLVDLSIADIIIDDREIDHYKSLGDYWWHPIQRALMGIDVSPGGVDEHVNVLRLRMDKAKMIEYNITLYKVAALITAEKPNLIRCIYGPFSDGIIDIYPRHDTVMQQFQKAQVMEETVYHLFLNQCIRPHFAKLRISGKPGVAWLKLGETPVITAILTSIPASRRMKEVMVNQWGERLTKLLLRHGLQGDFMDMNVWVMRKKKMVIFFEGVSNEEITALIKAAGIKVLSDDENRVIVVMPPDAVRVEKKKRTVETSPGVFGKEEYEVTVPVKPAEYIGKHVTDENLLNHRFAILGTPHLREIRNLPYCDRRRTYSNNFHVMTSVLGVEVARAYHVYSCHNIIMATGQSVNYRYFESFSNISMQKGSPSGVTFTGIAKQTGGFLSQATIEQSGKVLSESAIFNSGGETVKSVSSALSVGQIPFVGTGAYDYGVDFTAADPTKLLEEATAQGKFDMTDFDKALEAADTPVDEQAIMGTIFDQADGDDKLNQDELFRRGIMVPKFNMVRATGGAPKAPTGIPMMPTPGAPKILPPQPIIADLAKIEAILLEVKGIKITRVQALPRGRPDNFVIKLKDVTHLVTHIPYVGTGLSDFIRNRMIKLADNRFNLLDQPVGEKEGMVLEKIPEKPVIIAPVVKLFELPPIPRLDVVKQVVPYVDTQTILNYARPL